MWPTLILPVKQQSQTTHTSSHPSTLSLHHVLTVPPPSATNAGRNLLTILVRAQMSLTMCTSFQTPIHHGRHLTTSTHRDTIRCHLSIPKGPGGVPRVGVRSLHPCFQPPAAALPCIPPPAAWPAWWDPTTLRDGRLCPPSVWGYLQGHGRHPGCTTGHSGLQPSRRRYSSQLGLHPQLRGPSLPSSGAGIRGGRTGRLLWSRTLPVGRVRSYRLPIHHHRYSSHLR